MPIVRLSGKMHGRGDPNRKVRARLLYRLFDAGWNIYNGNGDQEITLANIQDKIIESDAFVFTPGAQIEDFFKAASIFVGFQTNDKDLDGKTAAILNCDRSWDGFISIIRHLHDMGTVSQNPEDFLSIVYKPKYVVSSLEDSYLAGTEKVPPIKDAEKFASTDAGRNGSTNIPDVNVCVFCSASIKDQYYLDIGYKFGKMLSEEGWGCVSGAGRTGIMGQVVKGSVDNGGWSGGSNVPHIIEMEGLPEGLSEFWPRPDIYTRMEVMIERSNAFVIMPGGMGTFQELLALLILKVKNRDIMKGKPIVILNASKDDDSAKFWEPLLGFLKDNDVPDIYEVTDDVMEIIPLIKSS